MKKIFMAAMAAAMFFSCTSENLNSENGNPPDGKPGPVVVEGIPTYATFNFNLATSNSKAYADFNPLEIVADDVEDSKIGTGDLFLLIFNSTNALEYANVVTNNTHTCLLTSGVKKIFVISNLGANDSDHVLGNLVKTDASLIPANEDASFSFSNMMGGNSNGIGQPGFYALAFNAGTPQKFDNPKTGARTFNVDPLSTRANPGTLGLAMSNTTAYSFVLMPDVSYDEANGTVGLVQREEFGSELYNRFLVKLYFLGAKGRLVANIPGMNQTTAVITDPTYTIKNLAKYTSLVQQATADAMGAISLRKSIYHEKVWGSGTPVQADFDPHIDQASNAVADVELAASVLVPFIFVPENTHAAPLLRGQSSFYALNVTYKPNYIVWDIFFNSTPSQMKVNIKAGGIATYDALDTAGDLMLDSSSDPQYVYVEKSAVIPDSIRFFNDLQTYADWLWMTANELDITDASYLATDAMALLLAAAAGSDPDEVYKVFTNAQSWYRIDMGEGTTPNVAYGVLRGHAYTATVSNITGPGEPEEADLFTDPDQPVEITTNIHVTIQPAEWIPVDQEIPVLN